MNVTETFRGFSAQRSLPRDGERTELHALTLPLDVERTKTVRSGPSGSAIHMELHAQARVAVPPTLPLDVERTKTVRSGPSGSAIHMELHAQGRVAVPPTLPLDVERTGCTPSHCHSTSSVPIRCVQGRVVGLLRRRAGRPSGATAGQGHARARRHAGQGVCRPPGYRERRESDERREAPERAKRAWLKCEEGPAGRQREVREGPAPDRSHPGCGPGLPDGRGDANAAQKSMSTLLKNKFHSLSSGHIA